jgi:hypothetical protein
MQTKFEAYEVPVKRDELGAWAHPDFPWDNWPDNTSLDPYFESLNFRCKSVLMQDELEGEALNNYFDNSETDYSLWEPRKPDGAGWFLAAIHDTDEGPCARWVAPLK